MTDAFAALAAPRRRELLRLLRGAGERSAGELHRALPDVTFGAVSQHLRVLSDAGLVVVRADGRHRYYRVQRTALGPVAAWLEAMWDDALYTLQLRAELEQARRGPRPRRRRGAARRPR